MTTQELKQKIGQVLGNSIRCLLPSYWWKHLFNQVADRIDEVEQKVDEVEQKVDGIQEGVTIVRTIDELNDLDLPEGSVASVVEAGMVFGECYIASSADTSSMDTLFPKLTRVTSVVPVTSASLNDGDAAQLMLVGSDYMEDNTNYAYIYVVNDSGVNTFVAIASINGRDYFFPGPSFFSGLNKILQQNDLRFIAVDSGEDAFKEQMSILNKAFIINGSPDVYVKGVTWDKLAKEGAAQKNDDIEFIVGFNENGEVLLTEEEKTSNNAAFGHYMASPGRKCTLKYYLSSSDGEIDHLYPGEVQAESVGYSLLIGEGYDSVVFRGVNLGNSPFGIFRLIGKYDVHFARDGSALKMQNLNMGKVNFLYITGSSDNDWQRALNKDVYDMWTSSYGRPIPVMAWMTDDSILHLLPAFIYKPLIDGERKIQFGVFSTDVSRLYELHSDGSVELLETRLSFENELSKTSTSGVQNRVITAKFEQVESDIKMKVDAVEGKQLTTEDFTTTLKEKLEGLSNYNDTEIKAAVNGLRSDFDTLVGGNTSVAIESFNEIMAFLEGVEDSENLDSIIAAIQQQIAGKQAVIEDLDTIRANAAKGATALQSVPDEYVTESELNEKGYATDAQLEDKQDKIEDLDTIREGAGLGATALQEHQDISHLATKDELNNLTNEVTDNEEVTATALNDLNTRVASLGDVKANQSDLDELEKNAVTKEEFTSETLTNEEVLAAAINDLNSRLKEMEARLDAAGL